MTIKENAICMRSARVPVEMIIEYVRLFQMGDDMDNRFYSNN